MRYRHYFCENYDKELIDWLRENDIKYTVKDKYVSPPLVIFNIWSEFSDKRAFPIKFKELNISYSIVSAEYTSTEYNKAKFLMMRPKKQVVDIINSDESFVYSCEWTVPFRGSTIVTAWHPKQIGLIAIAEEPRMNNHTAFWCVSTGFSEIFADYRVVELVKKNCLRGIDFKSVILKNGCFSKNLFQLTSKNILSRDCIGLGYGERKVVCPKCGIEQYETSNAYQFHLDFSKMDLTNDLFVTENIFGGCAGEPIYIISQKFYSLLKENGLNKGVVFEPVVDISG